MLVLPFFILCLTSFTVDSVFASNWKVEAELNPGCIKDCSDFNLVVVTARNESYSVHFLFGAAVRISPSALILLSSNRSATPQVNWTSLSQASAETAVEAIHLQGIVQSYALAFTTLFEYDDVLDSADMSKSPEDHVPHLFRDLLWNMTSSLNSNPHSIEGDEVFEVVYASNSSNELFSDNGIVQLKFMLSNSDQRNPSMPQLKFVPGLSLQFELTLDRLHSNYTHGRFGLQLLLISNDTLEADEQFLRTSVFSINDEITPGIFEMVNVQFDRRTTDSNKPGNASWPPGYLQSKPVCYTSATLRDIKESRNVKLSKFQDSLQKSEDWALLKATLPYVFYGDRIEPVSSDNPSSVNPVGIRMLNISFGTPEDGFYKSSSFIVWTGSVGFGEPPVDNLSPLLIGLISFSTVIILGSLVLGTLLIVLFRRRGRTNDFQRLAEPETSSFLNVNT